MARGLVWPGEWSNTLARVPAKSAKSAQYEKCQMLHKGLLLGKAYTLTRKVKSLVFKLNRKS